MHRIPIVVPRLMDGGKPESLEDWIKTNTEAVQWFLENASAVRAAMQPAVRLVVIHYHSKPDRAVVVYCGHDASFVADIHRIGDVNVVVAATAPGSQSKFESLLTRPADPDATHHMVDFPWPVYWSPSRGVFAVPEKNVKKIKR